MLQTLHGGAAARPFVTHSNAFDIDLYLRIAPELFLKRCVVGGLEQVFEINRNFRNEGADSTHIPEFAMLEFYEAYGDYDTMATLTRELVQEAALAASGSLHGRPWTTARVTDLSGDVGPGRRVRVAVGGARGGRSRRRPRWSELRELVASAPASRSTPAAIHGKLVEELFEHHVVAGFTVPTFVRDFPVDTSPLVRAHRTDAGRGREVGPVRQRVRAGHRLLRAGRPGGPARAARRAGRARRRRRRRGDAARRGLPARAWSTACRRWAASGWASTGC